MYRSPVQPAINICENSFDNGFARLVERCDRHFPRKVENISIDTRDVDTFWKSFLLQPRNVILEMFQRIQQ